MSSQEHLAQCLGSVVHAVRTRKRPNDCTVRAQDLGRKGRRSGRKVRHSFKRKDREGKCALSNRGAGGGE
jgi:hypothetical protein